MPRQHARTTGQGNSTSLLSSVFDFVSREFDSFVSNATGRPPREDEEYEDDEEYDEEEEEDAAPQASSSRTQLRSRETRRQGEKAGAANTCRNNEHARDVDEVQELIISDRSRLPSPKPSSPALCHKRSFTMPGALYDRTSSLEPSPEPDENRPRVVRFASEVTTSPSPRKQTEMPRSANRTTNVEAGPSSGRKTTPYNPRARMSEDESSSGDERRMPSSPTKRVSRPRKNSFVQEAIRVMSTEKNPDPSLLLPRSPSAIVWSSPTKGKGKELVSPEVINIEDSGEESNSDRDSDRSERADLSVRTRVKGKERELHTARQQERERVDDEERRRDKERIRALEEELRKLREELARRPVAPQPYAILPPPPPPPPPPRPATLSRSQTSQPGSTFANVRASLRHAGPPVEKPINPAVYGGPAVRKGQPTINLDADRMTAFLNELKTHRLRRVGATGNESRSQPAIRAREVGDVGNRTEFAIRPREIEEVGNQSEFLPRPNRSFTVPMLKDYRRANATIPKQVADASETDTRVGEKRRHAESSHEAAQESMPSKRRAVAAPSLSTDSSGDSLTGLPISSANRFRLPMRPERHNGVMASTACVPSVRAHATGASDTSSISRVLSGIRAETEITTPSLSSDNENENVSNESQEGRSPPTPPPEQPIPVQGKTTTSRPATAGKAQPASHDDAEYVEVVDGDTYRSEQQQVNLRSMARNQESPQTSETFSRRPPALSRLLDSPRRPRPPTRPRATREVQHIEGGDDDEPDPLSLSYTSADAPSYDQLNEQESYEQPSGLRQAIAPESPPIRLPMRPPPGTFKPPQKHKANLSSRLPARKGSQKNRSTKETTRGPSSTNTPSSSSTLRRRDSLEAELRRAEAEYDADIANENIQLESGTLSGLGTRSRKRGYLAFGGAAGRPAIVDDGMLQDLENLETSDDEGAQSSRRMRRTSSTRRIVFGAFVSQPRWGQAVAVVDNLLYVYGGKTDEFGSYSYTSAPTTNDLFTLDLSQGFDPTSPPWNYVCGSEDSSSRQGQQLAWQSLSAYNTSQLLLFGGDGGPNSPIVLPSQTNSAQLLDVSDSSDPTWISEQEGWAGQPSRRIHHTATSVGGKVYLIGGERDDGSSFGYSDHYVFDPSTPSFTQLPTDNGPPDIYGHGSVVLSDGRLLVFGGYSQSESSLVPFSTIWSLDTRQSDSSWTMESVSKDSVPPGRRAFAFTWLEGDRVLIHGGVDAQFQTSYSDGWILDTTTDPMTWSNVSALTQVGARRDHFAVQVGSQVLLCFGYGTNAGSSVSLLVFDYDQDAFTSSFAPQSGSSLTTLPVPTGTTGTGGSSSEGSHGSVPGGTGTGSSPTDGSGKPSSTTDPGSDGGNEDGGGGDGDDKKKTAVIAVASIFGVLAIALAAGLLVLVVIRRRRSRRQFYLLNNEDEHPRPGASPPWELAGISILPWLKARRALARGEKTRIADKREGWTVLGLGRPRERVDMLANEDASELGTGRRQPGRLGSGDSRSWYSFHDGTSGRERYESGASIGRLFSGSLTSLKNIGSGVRRAISGGSAKSHRREWTDISLPLDPYDTHGDGEGLLLHDKNLSYGVENSLDELEGDIALAARPRGGKEGSNFSEYVDPFQDQVEGEVLFDVSPSAVKRGSLDGSEPSSSNTQSQKEVNARSSQSTLSQASVVPQLPPLVPATSKSTSDGPSSSSLLDGSNAGHGTSSSQHAALSVISSTRPRTSSIISSAPPSSSVKRSDSWWARFKRSRAGSFRENSQDLGKASFSRLDLDFRDPNPPPGRLGAIKEVSGGSSGAAESPRASHIGQLEESHEKTRSGSSSAGLYLAIGHEQSTTSLKTSRTADSAALERLAGKMDVAFREATGTSIDCGSSFSGSVGRRASHERDTTWSTLGSERHAVESSEDQDIVDGAVLDDRGRNIVQSPTEIATAPDLPSDRISGSIRMVSQSLPTCSPQSTTSLSATLKGLKGKNPISPGTVATRVADYERRMSIEIFSSPEATPTLSSPSPVSSRTPRSQNSLTTPMSATPTPSPKPAVKRKATNVKYGLVQRPELFIANPDRDRHSIGGSSDT
ncbi:hypothetical protein A7U60_g7591 [Sanghuangporus baumii]|uniref:Uncharacterized protein n=1 Tax=Sanghuangporus baumii TaxID=108892 RepID=A0A9Q5HSP2_SANBA|nr:hypothetical protein A7U60_g7591 [Sanghuangporus baumii]